MREFVSQQHQHQQNQYFILIEINESTLKIKNCSNENDVRFRLSKIFSFSSRPNERSRYIRLETLHGRPCDIDFHIDAQDLNLFKDQSSKNIKSV